MASVLGSPSELADGSTAEQAGDDVGESIGLRAGGDNVTTVASGAVTVGLLNFSELQLKHDLFIGVGAGHLFLDFSF